MITIMMAIFLIIALVSVVSGLEDSSELAIFERQEALLSFRYKADVYAPFSIGIDLLAPFYIDGQFITEHLSPSQLHRFQVTAWHYKTRQYTMIHLKINEVQRTDAGTYSCIFGTPHRLQMKALTVKFPPGRVFCRVFPTNRSMWETVRCSATGGSPRGRIICLDSKNEEIPFRGDVGENGTHIIHEILIQQNASLYCCAINGARLVKHKCNDFVLRGEYLEYFDENDDNKNHISNTQKTTIDDQSTTLSANIQTTGKEKSNTHANTWIYIAALALGVIGIMTICIGFLQRKNLKDRQKEPKKPQEPPSSTESECIIYSPVENTKDTITHDEMHTHSRKIEPIITKDISAKTIKEFETVHSTLPKLPPTTDIDLDECNDE